MGFFDGMKELARAGEFGDINPALLCPHCQVTGKVRAKEVQRKKGISKGKVAAAVLLSPLTLLATGIAGKTKGIDAHCDSCGISWKMA